MNVKFDVTGMTCAACAARVEKAARSVPGVANAEVNLLANTLRTEVPNPETAQAVISAVEQAGYHAALPGPKPAPKDRNPQAQALKEMKTRIIWSALFLVILMYFTMGHMVGLPLPPFLNPMHHAFAFALCQLILTLPILYAGRSFYSKGIKAVLHGSPNMDSLIAVGSGAALVYGVAALFRMAWATGHGVWDLVEHYRENLYFESAAMILTLITLGKFLETRAKGKTGDAIRQLMDLAPKTATVLRDGQEIEIPAAQVQVGDTVLVRAGGRIPVDGTVLEGRASVDQSALTGESVPVEKGPGDTVAAATVSTAGFLKFRSDKVGEDTTLSQIIKMVSDAAATKAPIAKIADRVSSVFVPAVITIAIITTIVWLLTGHEAGYALARGISVLVISCPCALGLATPVAIMVGNGMGAKNGILFKTAVSLEEAGKVQIVALDKTGTITNGQPEVTDILPADDVSENDLLTLAYALEKKSEHPLAKAILEKAASLGLTAQEVTEFQALPGNGLSAKLGASTLIGGSMKYISTLAAVSPSLMNQAEKLAEAGKTPLLFAKDGKLLGIIAVADVIKPDSAQAVKELQNMGIHVVMLTGDNKRTARAIGAQAGVDQVIAGVLPDGKESVIRSLKEKGKVAMVGDGINDAPALTRADIGIAIGAGTDVAIDAADIVLMKSQLSDVPAAIRMSRATLRNIHENLFWAFFYNVIGIPLAAGVWIPIFGWTLNPMFGAAAMSLSSFCVVTNALRLNLFKIHDAVKDKKVKNPVSIESNSGNIADFSEASSAVFSKSFNADKTSDAEQTINNSCKLLNECSDINNNTNKKENNTMVKVTVNVTGMMCGHCEAHVNKAIQEAFGVQDVVSSHDAGTTIFSAPEKVDEDKIRQVIKDAGYEVTGITQE